MKYPMINKQPRREVNVPALSGGLNLRDSLTGIRDNQMSDCVNMWYKEGMLRTRPPLTTFGEYSDGLFSTEGSADDFGGMKIHKDIKDTEGRVLVSHWNRRTDLELLGENTSFDISFIWQGIEDAKLGRSLSVSVPKTDYANYAESLTTDSDLYSSSNIGDGYFVVHKDGVLYVVVHFGGKYFYEKWEYEKEGTFFEKMNDLNDFYAPLVIINDVQLRGYNLFGGRYKGRYEYNTGDEKTKYDLPLPIPKNSKLRIWIAPGKAEKVFEFKGEDGTEELTEECMGGKLKIKVVRAEKSYIQFLKSDGSAVEKVSELDVDLIGGYFDYNTVCDISEDMHKVFGMKQQIYYDTGAEGISGGSRLFLTANKAGKERNLVMWSSLDNVLYWPENNYAYIGDKAQAVTGFGKQGENLIIFKEKSTYYSVIVYNNDITEEDIIEQRIIDLEANSAYLAIRLFNDSIGCDLPNTVALCRNRLVWACSNGCVYTLVSNDQYSQRTIFKVSEMIEAKLKKERTTPYSQNDKAIKHAYGFDCGEHYCLAVDNRMYMMDYNSYGYRYISSFSKNDDSNAQIPWYYWEFPGFRKRSKDNIFSTEIDDGVRVVMSIDDCVLFLSKYIDTNYGTKCRPIVCADILNLESEGHTDEFLMINDRKRYEVEMKNSVINSCVTTKYFDFGAAAYAKNIDGVSVGFGSNGGAEITVNFLSNVGNESYTASIARSDVEERDAAYVMVKTFYPCLRSMRAFGIRFKCEGLLILDSLSLKYRLLGGIK